MSPTPNTPHVSDSRADGLLLAAHDAVGETEDVETVAKDCSDAVAYKAIHRRVNQQLVAAQEVDPYNG